MWVSFTDNIIVRLSDFCDDKFCDCVMSESFLPSGNVLHSLFAILLSFTPSSKIQFEITSREEFARLMENSLHG